MTARAHIIVRSSSNIFFMVLLHTVTPGTVSLWCELWHTDWHTVFSYQRSTCVLVKWFAGFSQYVCLSVMSFIFRAPQLVINHYSFYTFFFSSKSMSSIDRHRTLLSQHSGLKQLLPTARSRLNLPKRCRKHSIVLPCKSRMPLEICLCGQMCKW